MMPTRKLILGIAVVAVVLIVTAFFSMIFSLPAPGV